MCVVVGTRGSSSLLVLSSHPGIPSHTYNDVRLLSRSSRTARRKAAAQSLWPASWLAWSLARPWRSQTVSPFPKTSMIPRRRVSHNCVMLCPFAVHTHIIVYIVLDSVNLWLKFQAWWKVTWLELLCSLVGGHVTLNRGVDCLRGRWLEWRTWLWLVCCCPAQLNIRSTFWRNSVQSTSTTTRLDGTSPLT